MLTNVMTNYYDEVLSVLQCNSFRTFSTSLLEQAYFYVMEYVVISGEDPGFHKGGEGY